jgi:hypothetical protein
VQIAAGGASREATGYGNEPLHAPAEWKIVEKLARAA